MGNPPNYLFPISLLMDRVIARFNPTNCSGLNITYSFIFDDYEPIYIEVKDGFARPIQGSPLMNIDTTIKTTHLIWQKICIHELSAKNALTSNLVQCEGNIKNYFLLTDLIDETMLEDIIYKHKESTNKSNEDSYKEFFEPTITTTKTINSSNDNIISSPTLNKTLIKEEIATEQAEKAKEQVKRARANAKKAKKSAQKAKRDANKEKQKTKKLALKKEKEDKRRQKLESLKEKKAIPIQSIMKGMVAGFNPKEAKDLDITYKFIFDEEKIIYLQIKDQTAKLSSKSPGDIDTIINTTYDTWYKIAFEGLDGEDAFLDGLVKCEGNIKNYAMIPKLFKTTVEEEEEIPNLYPRLNPLIWVALALVPWIFYWSAGEYFSSLIISTFGIIYLTLFILFLKPPNYRKLTKLEALTFIAFPAYHLLNILTPIFNNVVCSFLLNIILILVLFLSVGSKMSVMAEYSQISFDPMINKTKLFRLINRNLTILWGIIFTLRFITELILPGPLSNLGYIFIAIGVITSYVYPKIKLGN